MKGEDKTFRKAYKDQNLDKSVFLLGFQENISFLNLITFL